jgi:4-amino-4-deoxy-L-arabinose transferase-like glycosyltransferase
MKRNTFLLYALLILGCAAYTRLAGLHLYPPGLHYDEAADMLLGRDIAFFGFSPFPVVNAYSGREALFYYLSVPLLHIFGPNIMATRLTSAFLGILTVAATMAFGRAAFRHHPSIALLAGAWLAISGPQIWLMRQGFRTSPQPFLEAMALWLFALMLNRRRWWWPALLGGFFTGVTLYVYMAARIFPPFMAMALLLLILLDAKRRGLRLRQSLLFGSAALLTAGPILLFYATNPQAFLDRLSQLAPTGQTITLLESLRLHVEMFFLRGDPILRYNLSVGRPWFDLPSGLLMLLGLAGAAWLALRRPAAEKTAWAMVALGPLLIIPSLIAVAGFPPSHMRSVAMVPLIFFAPAVGVFLMAARLNQRLIYGAAALLIALSGAFTWRDYLSWAARSDVFYQADGDLMLAGQWLTAHAESADVIYVQSIFYEHPTLLSFPFDHSKIRWMTPEQFFAAPPGQRALYIIRQPLDQPLWKMLAPPLEALSDVPQGPDGAPAFYAFASNMATLPATPAADVDVGGTLALALAQATPTPAGQKMALVLGWNVLATPKDPDWAVVIRLMDSAGQELARTSPFVEQSQRWQPGETLYFYAELPIPAGTAPDTYAIEAAWVGKNRPNTYIPLQKAGAFAGVWQRSTTAHILLGAPINAQPSAPPAFAQTFALEIGQLPAQAEQGDLLPLPITWWTRAAPPQGEAPASLLFTLADSSGSLATSQRFPSDPRWWGTGQLIRARYALPVPLDIPAGQYTYCLRGDAPPCIAAGHIEIRAADRNFTVPTDLTPIGARFGEFFQLAAYGVEPLEGNRIRLTLAWQALQTADADYTVFVHVVQGGTNFDQADQQPARPATRLAANEVLIEHYEVRLPTEGEYTVQVGFYLQSDGRRLPVAAGDFFILPKLP